VIPKQEFLAMLKIISAAIVAASVMVAPAMAATVIKTEKTTITHSQTLKPSVANAYARGVSQERHRHNARQHRKHIKPHHHYNKRPAHHPTKRYHHYR
jgi:hypothetical protein